MMGKKEHKLYNSDLIIIYVFFFFIKIDKYQIIYIYINVCEKANVLMTYQFDF